MVLAVRRRNPKPKIILFPNPKPAILSSTAIHQPIDMCRDKEPIDFMFGPIYVETVDKNQIIRRARAQWGRPGRVTVAWNARAKILYPVGHRISVKISGWIADILLDKQVPGMLPPQPAAPSLSYIFYIRSNTG